MYKHLASECFLIVLSTIIATDSITICALQCQKKLAFPLAGSDCANYFQYFNWICLPKYWTQKKSICRFFVENLIFSLIFVSSDS